jgi:putative transposase
LTRRDAPSSKGRIVTAKRPDHVWHVDLTMVPTLGGFWARWLPHALAQVWPFCWWVGLAVDHYSRRVMGVAVFYKPPSSEQVRAFLGRAIAAAEKAPKYIICDKGSQFWCAGFKDWCKRRGIRPRFGAIGQHGSIAVVERFIRTLKYEGLAGLVIPLCRTKFRAELLTIIGWYNAHRPHTTLRGRTPDEVYFRQFPANRKPRIEPRPGWPRGSPCATPQTLVADKPGDRFTLDVTFVDGREALPIVRLRRAA